MGFFRRRHPQDEQTRKGPAIEEVDATDSTPHSTTQPTVEEPDESGQYASDHRRSHHQDNYTRLSQPADDFFGFGDMRMPGFGGPMPGFGFGEPMPGFGRPMPGFGQPMPGFGGSFGAMDLFHSSFFGDMDPFSMHRPRGSMFDDRDSFFGHPRLQGASQSKLVPRSNEEIRSGQSQNPSQFQYQFQSWESTRDQSGKVRQRHLSARGSSDEQLHHLSESIKNETGQVRTRQETIPFEGRPRKVPAITEQ